MRRPAQKPHPVRAYRERHGVSMGALARRAGLSTPALSRIERGGVAMPAMPILVKLVNASEGEVTEVQIFKWHFETWADRRAGAAFNIR